MESIIITGASGFIGRNIIDDLKKKYRIFAIARRSQYEANIIEHPNVAYFRTDISDQNQVTSTFREIKTAGGAHYFIHLAAYYDFSGKNNSQYFDTNIKGTQLVIDAVKDMNLNFIQSSGLDSTILTYVKQIDKCFVYFSFKCKKIDGFGLIVIYSKFQQLYYFL